MIENRISNMKVSKTSAVKALKENGYEAVLKNGVVLVKWIDSGTFRRVSKFLKGIGYDCSFGVTPALQPVETSHE